MSTLQLLICFVFANIVVVPLAMAEKAVELNAPAPTPADNRKASPIAETPTIARKLGIKHQQKVVISSLLEGSSDPLPPSPAANSQELEIAQAPISQPNRSEQPLTVVLSSSKIAEAPVARRLGRHHSSGKSVAGGGVILGGLATTFFVSIFCYIRATRRRNGQTTSS
ncbi:PREDICTED: uncharacterized protein LOC104597066 [Nelumbo nucifera]|uniref:Transmembrane protein n=2 Tax=Nelumbo nucifera TaxID=4432 RepID=A0A822Y295_NELNU|nr:PREDICTED: uncharacterized protein LOC104597066 [Nelumbo nucifera]DAD26567.1 TPA_asm: hypothetical protein HUJ06_028035 [Nelumbo nucifera]